MRCGLINELCSGLSCQLSYQFRVVELTTAQATAQATVQVTVQATVQANAQANEQANAQMHSQIDSRNKLQDTRSIFHRQV